MTDESAYRKYLLPEDDGLVFRTSQSYAEDKLILVKTYVEIAAKSMKNTEWRETFYIDLMAGPGKNKVKGSNTILMGSPLIALTASHPFTQYRLNELKVDNFKALSLRVNASPVSQRVKLFKQDVNDVVHTVCDEIKAIDEKYIPGTKSCFNVCFLDPEGLDIKWTTVTRLASMYTMDLIMLFSTGGLIRVLGLEKEEHPVVDEFFGTKDWRNQYEDHEDATNKRRKLINYYLSRLEPYGYKVFGSEDRITSTDVPFKNSKNSQLYSIIFASKHKLGYKFWDEARKQLRQPSLF